MAKAMTKIGMATPAAMAAVGEDVLGELPAVVLGFGVDIVTVVANTVAEEDVGDARDEDIYVDVA
jgi:hypothetical protein